MGSDAAAVKDEEPGRAGLWEDFVDIFYAPSSVFARRSEGKFGMPLLFLVLVGTVLFFLTKNATQPIMDAEFTRQTAAAMRKNPNITAEQMASSRGFFEMFSPDFLRGRHYAQHPRNRLRPVARRKAVRRQGVGRPPPS